MKTVFTPAKDKSGVVIPNEFNFPAKLKSISNNVMKFTNAKGNETSYRIGAIDFTYPDGRPATDVQTMIFEANFAHGMEVGSTLLSTLQVGNDGNIYLRTSHLHAGNRADASAFASLFSADAVTAQPAGKPVELEN